MLLKISYEDGSGREVIPLSANETYFVGESSTLTLPAGAGVVRLRGSHVSSPQFVLRKSGQGWSVQHHGRNPTRVDDQPLRVKHAGCGFGRYVDLGAERYDRTRRA